MSAPAQILRWSEDQPLWRRDALRRLLTASFGPKDENEILDLLKADQGLAETRIEPVPLSAEHLPSLSEGTKGLSIVSLSDVENANRLAPEQTLTFGPKGITLVYGDNGSGKSGYARILKKACRARLTESILNNIFDAKASKAPARANIVAAVEGGKPTTIPWEDGKPGPTELSRVSVFDSKCASVYVDSENQVTFIPYNLDCFERLVKLCDRLKSRLSEEEQSLRATTAIPVIALVDGTNSHAFLGSLASKTDDDLAKATAWTNDDADRLKELSKLASDPDKRALELRQTHAQAKAFFAVVEKAAPYLTESAIGVLKDKRAVLDEAREAVRIAAADTFAAEPLSGVGSSPWRVLYEAARAYSEQEAYVEKGFPAAAEGDRCVLCHQPLSDDAKLRFGRFEAFVRGTAAAREVASQADWDETMASFREATSPLSVMNPVIEAAIKSLDASVADHLTAYLTRAVKVRAQVEGVLTDGQQGEIDTPLTLNLGDLATFLSSLEEAASVAEAAAKDEVAVKLRSELSELQARSLMHENKAQVAKRLNDLRTLKKLEGAIRACGTTGISQKGTELLKEHVTGKFENTLVEERKELGIEGLPLRLNSRSPKGAPSHQIKLDQTTFAGNTSAVLSEGEHRALALAAFLTEQRMISNDAPIIVDDPVSSLDHERRHKVTHRLVEEAKKRQVIVFTHDLLFYMDASFVCAEKQVALTKIGIRRGAKGYGTIDPDGDPWTAKVLGRRRAWLEQQQAKLAKLHTDGADEEYEKECRFFYDRLRETWERLIEEGLFANVIVRYRRGVETRRLPSAVLDDELVMRVFNGMSTISEYTGHDRPAAAGAALPDPDAAKQHLGDLVACMEAIAIEAKKVEESRKKLEKAPVIAASTSKPSVAKSTA